MFNFLATIYIKWDLGPAFIWTLNGNVGNKWISSIFPILNANFTLYLTVLYHFDLSIEQIGHHVLSMRLYYFPQ